MNIHIYLSMYTTLFKYIISVVYVYFNIVEKFMNSYIGIHKYIYIQGIYIP